MFLLQLFAKRALISANLDQQVFCRLVRFKQVIAFVVFKKKINMTHYIVIEKLQSILTVEIFIEC